MSSDVVVSPAGIEIDDSLSVPVTVLFDEQQVWSLNPARDAVRRAGRRPIVAWPRALQPFLDGVTAVTVKDHNADTVLFAGEVAFGRSRERIRVVDANGHPVAVDKGGHLQRMFSRTDQSTIDFIMDSVEAVLTDLREECGLDAYLVYGCLLGAVRTGHLIGHDADADVSYYSRHTHPFDIALESRRVERAMRQRGWRTVRMSAADFKVWVQLGDGRRCGVDVFTSFHIDDKFCLMASLRGDLPKEAILPLGTVTLEGREIPAPADPEALLAYTYGPSWRVPDPSFRFEHPKSSTRRMSGWWRGPRKHHRHWQDFSKTPAAAKPSDPSTFAQWVAPQLGPGTPVLDCGAGNGRDTTYFASLGHAVTALDFVASRLKPLRSRPRVSAQTVNFNDTRSVLVTGARLARRPRTPHIYARHLLDSVDATGRQEFWRFASMVQRRGGLTFVEFRLAPPRKPTHPQHPVDVDRVIAEIQARGGTVLHRAVGRGLTGDPDDPEACRLIVRWTR